MKLKLYLDFDGVILDTAEIADKKMIDLNLTEIDEIDNYYKNIDWYLLMKEAKQINNSLSNIKKLIDSNLYDIEIFKKSGDLIGFLKRVVKQLFLK